MLLVMLAFAALTNAVAGSTDALPKKNDKPDFQRTQALRLLEEAKLQAGTLEPASAAGLFMVVGQAYTPVDKKKAREALEIAYQNMRAAMEQSPDLVGFMAPDLIVQPLTPHPTQLNRTCLQRSSKILRLQTCCPITFAMIKI